MGYKGVFSVVDLKLYCKIAPYMGMLFWSLPKLFAVREKINLFPNLKMPKWLD
jgi:hypothetical protein